MPRKGFSTITIPYKIYELLQSFCYRRNLDLGKCVYFLYLYYQSTIHDSYIAKDIEKKIERIIRKIDKQWKEIIRESKESESEE